MAKKKTATSKKQAVKNYTKKMGMRLPHGYELVVRKRKK